MEGGQFGKTILMKLGVIGYSEGNGHPFSFSAILNGYNEDKLHYNPVKPINDYLVQQPLSQFGIGDMKVTHVWTPDSDLNVAIASVSKVENVVDDFMDMLDAVDGVLILRDDQHKYFASPFLEAGKYVFIDKPLAGDEDELAYFRPYLENAQLMSCSGLRYSPNILSLKAQLKSSVKLVYSNTVDNWLNYGIHSLEGIDPLLAGEPTTIQYIGSDKNKLYRVMYDDDCCVLINLSGANFGGIRSHLHLESGDVVEAHFNDNFNSFRNTLVAFYRQVQSNVPSINPQRTILLQKVILSGLESYNHQGKLIKI